MVADPSAMVADPDPSAMTADPSAIAADLSAMAADPSAMTADPSAMTADPSAMTADSVTDPLVLSPVVDLTGEAAMPGTPPRLATPEVKRAPAPRMMPSLGYAAALRQAVLAAPKYRAMPYASSSRGVGSGDAMRGPISVSWDEESTRTMQSPEEVFLYIFARSHKEVVYENLFVIGLGGLQKMVS